jgi:hypothetical protein
MEKRFIQPSLCNNMNEKTENKIIAIFLIVIALLFALLFMKNNITGYAVSSATSSSKELYCTAADFAKLSSSSLANCAKTYNQNGIAYNIVSLVKSSLQKNGMTGYDPLLVLAQFYHESGCNQDQKNGQGIGQVVACAKDHCSITENIDRAISQHIKPSYNIVESSGVTLTPDEKFRLVAFGYNRGVGTLRKALDFIRSGSSIELAMKNSCYYYYDQGSYGGCSGYNKERCCQIGLDYGTKILAIYKTSCQQIGGKRPYETVPPAEIPKEPDIPDGASGVYQFEPTFKTETSFSLNSYQIAIDQAKQLAKDIEACKIYKDTGETFSETSSVFDTTTFTFNQIIINYKKQKADTYKCLVEYKPVNWELDCENKDINENDDTYMFCIPLPYKIKLLNEKTNKFEEITPKIKFAMVFETKEGEPISTECSGEKSGYIYSCSSVKECEVDNDGMNDPTMEGCDSGQICCKQFVELKKKQIACEDLQGYECKNTCTPANNYLGVSCPNTLISPGIQGQLMCCLSDAEETTQSDSPKIYPAFWFGMPLSTEPSQTEPDSAQETTVTQQT